MCTYVSQKIQVHIAKTAMCIRQDNIYISSGLRKKQSTTQGK